MSQRENVLDGLAWAGISEEARVARLAAQLVREQSGKNHTQTHIKDTIRNTAPPYGRAKYIFNKLFGRPAKDNDPGEIGEIERQYDIWIARQRKKNDWERYLQHQARRSTRLNNAYAAAFDRPPYEPNRDVPKEIKWTWCMGHEHPNREKEAAWQREENERDKGDVCLAITHQNDYTVALVQSENTNTSYHIATRLKRGPIVRTYLRESCDDLPQAVVSLGGPKVRAAIAKGKRVKTDWVGRRSFIYHDGSDHEQPKVEEVPWLACRYIEEEVTVGFGTRTRRSRQNLIVHGKSETVDRRTDPDEIDNYYHIG